MRSQMVDESCWCTEHRLQTAYQVGWNTDQYCIAVVKSRVYPVPLWASETWLLAPLGGSNAIDGEHRSTVTLFVWRALASTSLHQCNSEITDGPRQMGRAGVIGTPTIGIAGVGSWCWRRLVEHQMASDLSGFSISLFDLVQAAIFAASVSTAADEHEP